MIMKAAPKINAIKRRIGLATVADTSAPNSLKLPPSIAINIKTAPKTKDPMTKLCGMTFSFKSNHVVSVKQPRYKYKRTTL